MAANSLKATLPSLQSMKVPQEPILITENEGEIFSHASCGMIGATHLYLTAFGPGASTLQSSSCPHPLGTSDGPDPACHYWQHKFQ